MLAAYREGLAVAAVAAASDAADKSVPALGDLCTTESRLLFRHLARVFAGEVGRRAGCNLFPQPARRPGEGAEHA